MARPERNNVDYFPLYTDNGRKMYFIETKYGNDGYATWLKILTELAKADYHFLNLKDNTQKMFLSATCKVDETTLNNIIFDLVKLGEFNEQLWTSNSILFSEKFVESISDAYKKRSNKPPTLQSLVTHLKGLRILKPQFRLLKGDVKPQRIEEDSKEEDKIEKIREWYRKQIVLSGNNKKYTLFAKFLFDDNDKDRPLTELLFLKEQITWEFYQILEKKIEVMREKKGYSGTLKQKVMGYVNGGYKKKIFFGTMDTWITGDANKIKADIPDNDEIRKGLKNEKSRAN